MNELETAYLQLLDSYMGQKISWNQFMMSLANIREYGRQVGK